MSLFLERSLAKLLSKFAINFADQESAAISAE